MTVQDWPDFLPIGMSIYDAIVLDNPPAFVTGGTPLMAAGVRTFSNTVTYSDQFKLYLANITLGLPGSRYAPDLVRVRVEVVDRILGLTNAVIYFEGGSGSFAFPNPVQIQDSRAPIMNSDLYVTWWGGYVGTLAFDISAYYLEQFVKV